MKHLVDTNHRLSFLVLLMLASEFVIISATINASIDYEVEGAGFHRLIRYHVDMGNFFQENCFVALHLQPDPTLYVNVDELADLERQGKTMACSDGEIDVELFSEKARNQNITVCAPLRTSDNFLRLPIHQRYQLARENDEYVHVTLPRPKLLVGCQERIREYPPSKIDLCSPCVDLSLKWREIPYEMNKEEYVWTMPVGELSDIQWVTNVTLIVVLCGTIVILQSLWFFDSNKKKKKN